MDKYYKPYNLDSWINTEGCLNAYYLNTLQLNSNTLFVLDGAVLSLSKLVRQSHIFQLQMLNYTNLSHLSSLREEKTYLVISFEHKYQTLI